ncbi:MAG: VanW family protein [Bacteroidota bacterium]
MELPSKNRMELILFSGKIIIGTLLFLSISLITAYLIWSEGRIIHGVRVGGIRLGGMNVSEATNLLVEEMEAFGEKKVVLLFKKRPLNIVLNSIGIKLDIAESIEKAYQIGRTGSFWAQMAARWRIYRHGYDVRPVFNNNRVSLNSFFHLLEASIGVEPVRSVVKVNKEGEIAYSPSRTGLAIDQTALAQKLENAMFQRDDSTIEIPIKKVIPPLTEDDIKRWGLDQVLGIFTTKYEVNHKDRVNNLLIASSAINNVIVYPGQIFSFNTWVGPRATEAGYKEAPVVYLGKLIPGVGGGVCQVSSTLYNAVLLSNLTIIQRLNHSLPISYVPLARDATVVYDGVDLIIENTSQFPILIVSNVTPPYLTVAILGRRTNWKKVELETKVVETYPYQTKVTPDPTLTKGSKQKVISGRKGTKVELWRMVEYIDGTLKKELVNTSIYPAQPEEYKIATKSD